MSTKCKAKYALVLPHKDAIPYQKCHISLKEHSAYTAISVASVTFFSVAHMAPIWILFVSGSLMLTPIPVAARSKVWVCGR
jgi:hypothetical protein